MSLDVHSWDEKQVCNWLDSVGMQKYSQNFMDNNITGETLFELTLATLKECGIASVGDRARILQAIKKNLSQQPSPTSVEHSPRLPLSPLLIAPRSSSMKTTTTTNSLMIQTHQSKLEPSPRSPSPVSPLAQLMSLGFLPSDAVPSTPVDSRKPLKTPAEDKDIMQLEHIKARCIRVKGVNNQSHIIDVSDLNDAKSIKEKIYQKFNITEESQKNVHAIFAQNEHQSKCLANN